MLYIPEVILIMVIFTAFLLFMISKKKPSGIKAIMEALGLKPRTFLISSRTKMTREGEIFVVDFSPYLYGEGRYSSYGALYFEILLPFSTPFSFEIKKAEDGFRPEQPYFDEEFVLDAGTQAEAHLLFENPAIREALKKAFNGWIQEISLDGKYLRAKVAPPIKGEISSLREIPTNLINLKNLLKQYELQGYGSKKTFPSKRLFILYLVPAFFSIAQILFAIFFSFQGGRNYEPLKFGKLVFTSLILFLPLCFLYLFASYRVLARYPGTIKKFYVCLGLCIVWFLTSLPFVQTLNGYFDKSTPKVKEFTVVGKLVGEGTRYVLLLGKKEGTIRGEGGFQTYYNVLDPDSIRLSVKMEEYLKAKPGQSRILVFIRRGILGIEWSDGYKFLDGQIATSKECRQKVYALLVEGKLEECISIASQCIEQGDKDSLLHYNRGVAYRKMGLYEKAIFDFQKAIELKPDLVEAYKNIDWILTQKKEWERVVSYWSSYIKVRPDDPEGYIQRAGAYYHWGRLKEAKDDLKKGCELKKNEACELLRKLFPN